MQSVHSIVSVGDLAILKTDGGTHSARQWARVVVGRIVQVQDEATPERAKQINAMRHLMVEALEPYFGEALAHRFYSVGDAFLDVVEPARGTPWEQNFAHSEIRAAIMHLLQVNLTTAERT